ncbi:hypothetical protein E3N88_00126 [Mikania micrantha]|uniref:Reverse transcriptase Ty1/copia-type domain-containing protein n=1 Tax=Mikania micrantha TaxID=192012 RepID=A0A5N6PZX9_9ASTR|nr:hypothetical protein E3N88_00126 [Mikania micrantha]
MNDEMEALNRNGTWILSDLPVGRKPIGCKWIYKVKYKSNGQMDGYKAILVAKGYNQREGIDFDETFSHVVKMVTVRYVYMTLPEGYFSKNETKVCRLVKSLYGLKQSPRNWNGKLTSTLLEMGFVQSISDYSLFVKNDSNVYIVLLVYVDDIVITGSKPVSTPIEQDIVIFDKESALPGDDLLENSPGQGLTFSKGNLSDLKCYVDSDWAKCKVSRRSTAESEYRAMCDVTCEVMWLLNLFKELHIDISLPVDLYCDNSAALSIAANPVFHDRTKHFEIDLHFIREKISSGIVSTKKIDTTKQVADIFTKGLGTKQHKFLCKQLGLSSVFAT